MEQEEFGEFLFYQSQQDVLAVPGSFRRFQESSMIILLGRFFDGFIGYPENLRFERAYKACHLRQTAPDKYEITSRGFLKLKNVLVPQRDYPIPSEPPQYESFISKSTTAIQKVIPGKKICYLWVIAHEITDNRGDKVIVKIILRKIGVGNTHFLSVMAKKNKRKPRV